MTYSDETFIVVCLDDGEHILATRHVFGTRAEACAYANTINFARCPTVVAGRWHELRMPVQGE